MQASTKHCNKCGICIDKFDHHCVWLNLCIGSHNYRLFIWTVVVVAASLSYTAAYGVAVCIPQVDSSHVKRAFSVRCTYKDTSKQLRMAIVITSLVIDALAVLLLIQLLIFHSYLSIRHMTTYEFIVRNKVRPLSVLSAFRNENEMNSHSKAVVQTVIGHASSRNWSENSRPVDAPILVEPISLKSEGIRKQESEVDMLRQTLEHQNTQRLDQGCLL